MKKISKILIIFTLFFGVYFLAGGVSKAGAALSCVIASSCPTGVVIMNLSGVTNAHAELFSQSNYSNLVCCTGVVGLNNTCSDTFAVVARLSGSTNAHIEQNNQTNFNYDANQSCLSMPSGGSVNIGYQDNNCTGYDTILASMSGITNAHTGDGSAYTKKICASASIAPPVIPSDTSISINGGTSTTSTSVTLTLGATNATEMMVSNSSSFSGANWESFLTSKNWSLLSGDGTKTVYVKFKSSTGGITSVISDTIILATPVSSGGGGSGPIIIDITPPTNIFISIANGVDTVNSANVNLTLGATEAIYMMIANDSSFSGANWENYNIIKNWVLTSGSGNKTVYVKYKDNTGNISSMVSDSISLDVTVTTTTETVTVNSSGGGIDREIVPPVEIYIPGPQALDYNKIKAGNCEPYLREYIKFKSVKNSKNEVKKLQLFLRDYENFKNLKITGNYNLDTFTAAKIFQTKYTKDILLPWKLTKPTGYVYISTVKKINELYCFYKGNTSTIKPVVTITKNGLIKPAVLFTHSLKYGDNGRDVKILQQFLNDNGFIVAGSGAGSPGNETEYFGLITKKAVMNFQNKYKTEILIKAGLSVATGYFGPSSIRFVNGL